MRLQEGWGGASGGDVEGFRDSSQGVWRGKEKHKAFVNRPVVPFFAASDTRTRARHRMSSCTRSA